MEMTELHFERCSFPAGNQSRNRKITDWEMGGFIDQRWLSAIVRCFEDLGAEPPETLSRSKAIELPNSTGLIMMIRHPR